MNTENISRVNGISEVSLVYIWTTLLREIAPRMVVRFSWYSTTTQVGSRDVCYGISNNVVLILLNDDFTINSNFH